MCKCNAFLWKSQISYTLVMIKSTSYGYNIYFDGITSNLVVILKQGVQLWSH